MPAFASSFWLILDTASGLQQPSVRGDGVLFILFTQPGMRYCQAQALVHALMKEETFASHSEWEKT